MASIHGFVSNSKSPLTTKLGKMVNKQCINFTLQVMLASLILGYMTNNFVFVYSFICFLPNTLGRIVDQHALALVSKWWWRHRHGIMWSRCVDLVLISWWRLYQQLLTNGMVWWSTVLSSLVIKGLLELEIKP